MTNSFITPKNDSLVSIILPTYNESQNILKILRSIKESLPENTPTEAIVVDDNSPDGTGKIVEDFIKKSKNTQGYTVGIIKRTNEKGLSSAILSGIQHAKGDIIVIMDTDLSHPPQVIPKMLDELKKSQCDIVIASRYIRGGKIKDWPLKRKMMSKVATAIAKKSLGVKTDDPMSGFFAFRRQIIQGLNFDAIGYKMLLEILVKTHGVNVKEIPYTFTNRKLGSSKVNVSTILDYTRAVWKLYRYGKSRRKEERRPSVRFLSKAGRFYSVGATGFGVNYLISFLFTTGFTDFWYLHANVFGILVSMTSNFFLNKFWTFEDRDFSKRKTIIQYGKFVGFSSLGALIQLGMVFGLVETYQLSYPLALLFAVLTAALGNFLLNKKWTFKEKLWD